jgi:hypothetical protein
MLRIRWRTICAVVSVTILGASIVCDVPSLSAKDQTQSTTSKSDKSASKKKTDKRSGKRSEEAPSSADDNSNGGAVAGTTVGGGGVAVGGSSGGGSGSSGTSTQSGGTSSISTGSNAAPPGIGGTSTTKKTPKSTANRKGSMGGRLANSKQSPLNVKHPVVKKVIDIQNRNQNTWLNQKGVVGTSTGLDGDGNIVIRVQITGADSPTIPSQVEGVPVIQVLTGPVRFAQSNIPAPAPIGTSTFADTQGQVAVPCQGSNGTIACRMKDSNSQVYALSCNHVFAGGQLFVASWDQGTQTATDQEVTFFTLATSNALQPAGSLVGCRTPSNKFSNILGQLFAVTPFYAYYVFPNLPGGVPVAQYTTSDRNFFNSTTNAPNPSQLVPDTVTPNPPGNPPANNTPTNLTDSALVQTSTQALDTATPTGGYGVPSNKVVSAYLGQPVQKYGNGSKLTFGTVTGLNQVYTITVNIATPLTPAGGVLIKQGFSTTQVNGTGGTTITAGFAGNVFVPFSQQVEITPSATQPSTATNGGVFAFPGDSGALVVTHNDPLNPGNNPVAMVQATDTVGGAYCGDFQNVINDLVFWIAQQTGNQVILQVDNGTSSLQSSEDGKAGRASPFKP